MIDIELTIIRIYINFYNLEEFKYDLNLIWRNAKDYNTAPSSSIYKLANNINTIPNIIKTLY